VGGIQLITMARTGISHFSIADPECFEPSNVNRQCGAFISTLGAKKVDVLKDSVLNINPHARVESFPSGICEDNVDCFLKNASVVIDSIEGLYLSEKVMLAQKAREKNLFLVTSPTWGYGASLVVFPPQGMYFEEFFGITSTDDFPTKVKRYTDRLFPLKPDYLEPYPYGEDMLKGIQPASVLCLGTLISAAMITKEVISILLQNQEPITAPKVIQIDLFRRSFDIVDLSDEILNDQ
jgi:hypothetical protein